MNNIIAGSILAILTGIVVIWFFKKLIDSSLKNWIEKIKRSGLEKMKKWF